MLEGEAADAAHTAAHKIQQPGSRELGAGEVSAILLYRLLSVRPRDGHMHTGSQLVPEVDGQLHAAMKHFNQASVPQHCFQQ